jgi:hypothetical protein
MKARRVLVLLAAVALGLFLMSATALPRPDVQRFDPSVTVDGNVADDGPDDGPEDLPTGDDDNWDKPAPGGHPSHEDFGADGQSRWLGPELPEGKSTRPASRLSLELRLLLRAWAVFYVVR